MANEIIENPEGKDDPKPKRGLDQGRPRGFELNLDDVGAQLKQGVRDLERKVDEFRGAVPNRVNEFKSRAASTVSSVKQTADDLGNRLEQAASSVERDVEKTLSEPKVHSVVEIAHGAMNTLPQNKAIDDAANAGVALVHKAYDATTLGMDVAPEKKQEIIDENRKQLGDAAHQHFAAGPAAVAEFVYRLEHDHASVGDASRDALKTHAAYSPGSDSVRDVAGALHEVKADHYEDAAEHIFEAYEHGFRDATRIAKDLGPIVAGEGVGEFGAEAAEARVGRGAGEGAQAKPRAVTAATEGQGARQSGASAASDASVKALSPERESNTPTAPSGASTPDVPAIDPTAEKLTSAGSGSGPAIEETPSGRGAAQEAEKAEAVAREGKSIRGRDIRAKARKIEMGQVREDVESGIRRPTTEMLNEDIRGDTIVHLVEGKLTQREAGVEVHHKTHLNEDPSLGTTPENLEALAKRAHREGAHGNDFVTRRGGMAADPHFDEGPGMQSVPRHGEPHLDFEELESRMDAEAVNQFREREQYTDDIRDREPPSFESEPARKGRGGPRLSEQERAARERAALDRSILAEQERSAAAARRRTAELPEDSPAGVRARARADRLEAAVAQLRENMTSE